MLLRPGSAYSVLAGENGFYTPGQVGPDDWQYRSIPFAYEQSNYSLNADYQLTTKTQLSDGYEREEFHREFRERDRTWDDRFRIALARHSFEMATARLSYEYGDRRGSAYNYNPYAQFFTSSLPGYNNPDGAFPFPLADLRKYDIANRIQHVVKGRINMAFRDVLDGSPRCSTRATAIPRATAEPIARTRYR